MARRKQPIRKKQGTLSGFAAGPNETDRLAGTQSPLPSSPADDVKFTKTRRPDREVAPPVSAPPPNRQAKVALSTILQDRRAGRPRPTLASYHRSELGYIERYRENYDAIAHDHLSHFDRTGNNPFMRAEAEAEAAGITLTLARDFLEPGMRVLDAGCGPGRLLERLQETCGPLEGHGADISAAYLQRIDRETARPVQAMLERLPYADDSFNAVITTDVLEHVFDLHAVSRELVRVLKPGGTLIVRVPHEEALDTYLEQSDYAFVHVRSFSPAGLRLHFQAIFGLEYEDVRFSEPVYKGAQTLKSRPLSSADSDALFALLAPYEYAVKGAGELLRATRQDAGVIHAALNRLSIKAPELYRQAVAILARPLEMAMAFRKPGEN